MRTRRQFLQTAGAVALAGPALLGSPVAATAAGPPGAATLAGLRRQLRGPLLTPASAGWKAAAQLWNPRVRATPRAIARCTSEADVAAVLAFARRHRWPVAARGGRHSFAGYGNGAGGIVADLAGIDGVAYDLGSGLVRVGAGANVLDVYERLVLPHAVAIPVGTCPTVGIAGLTLGGGFGRLARRAGVTADALRAARVVTSGGRVLVCDAQRNADLFWALRGGGAGYAVVTELTFAVQPAPEVITWSLSYPWSQAGPALDAWQRTLPDAGVELAYGRFRALKLPDGRLTCAASGHWYGTEADLRALLAPLVAAGPTRTTLTAKPYADAALPDGTKRAADGTVSATVTRYPNYQRSRFFAAVLPAEGIAALLAQVERWPGGGADAHEGGVQLDAMGAAINAVAPGDTAFVHRRERFHAAYLSFWGASDSAATAAKDTQWVRDIDAALSPFGSGAAYQNYIDPELRGWGAAYFGENLARLRAVKRRYDPRDVLRFPQGVGPGRG